MLFQSRFQNKFSLAVSVAAIATLMCSCTSADGQGSTTVNTAGAQLKELPVTDFQGRYSQFKVYEKSLLENPDGMSEADRLNGYIQASFDYTLNEYPTFATYIGVPGDHGRWPDNSVQAIERRDKDSVDSLEFMKSIDREKLEGIDRLNYDLFAKAVEDQVTQQRFMTNFEPLTQLNGVQQNVSQLMAVMPNNTVEQCENMLSRLRGVPDLVDNTMGLMRLGLENGVTPPQITLRDVPQQVLNLLPDEAMQSSLIARFGALPDSIPEDERNRLREEAVTVYESDLKPAFTKLHTFLIEEYLPGARETIAMRELPDGEAWYAFNVEQMTTTSLSPQEIHEIGLSEVKRIRGEMTKVIEESGFEGTFEEFLEYLRTDPKFYFTDKQELISGYRDISKRADPELVKLFGTLPRTPYGVEQVPAYAEKSQTTAYYQPGTLEGGRPGVFFANTYALDTRPKWEMEALTLHEAVPGHHLQLALQQEIEDMAWFRRFGGYTAFIEGWGLYSESLGEEMGFYQDPYSKFGQLTYEMWRAIRLVVDTGMHQLGWSREQAIEFFMKNSGKTEHDVVVEVDRYIVWPGQALAYKIGELKIKELRAKAEKTLGDKFDIRVFHDTLLGNGALPLSVLETHMNEWLAEQERAIVAEGS